MKKKAIFTSERDDLGLNEAIRDIVRRRVKKCS